MLIPLNPYCDTGPVDHFIRTSFDNPYLRINLINIKSTIDVIIHSILYSYKDDISFCRTYSKSIMVQLKEEVTELRTKFKNNCRIKEYSTHSSKIHSVDWNCDGRRLASGGFDKSVCVVGLSNDRLSKEVRIFLCICDKKSESKKIIIVCLILHYTNLSNF